MIIVVDGPDGSGKTTISRKLAILLRNAGLKVRYKKFELALENLILTRLVYAILKRVARSKIAKYRNEYENALIGAKTNTCIDRLTSSFVILDKILTAIITKIMYKNRLLVIDAYIYDSLVPFYCRRLIPKSFYELIFLLGPLIKGDIELILDGPSVKLFERRKGIDYDSIEFVKCNRIQFRKIARILGSPVIYVDAPVNVTIYKVLDAILKQIPGYSREEHVFHLVSNPYNTHNFNEIVRNFELSEIDWKVVLHLAMKQNLLLVSIENLLRVELDKEFRGMLSNLLKRVVELKRKRFSAIIEITKLLDEADVNYVIFKTLTPFNSELDTDIDILIDIDDLQKAISALESSSWKHAYLSAPGKITNKISLLLYPSIALYKDGIELDLHPLINWGRLTLSPSEIKRILRNRRTIKYEGIEMPVLPREYEAFFIIAHAIYKHDRVNLWDIHMIRGISKEDFDWRLLKKLCARYRALEAMNIFLLIYNIKNIFYYEGDTVHLAPLLKTDIDLRECIVCSEITVSLLRKVATYFRCEHWYNFLKQILSSILVGPEAMLNIYRSKLRAKNY